MKTFKNFISELAFNPDATGAESARKSQSEKQDNVSAQTKQRQQINKLAQQKSNASATGDHAEAEKIEKKINTQQAVANLTT